MVLRNIDGRVSVKSRIASFSDFSPPKDTFFVDLISGFSKLDKSLPCKYFYDDEGSQLFDQICELSEYYLTRTEAVLLYEKAGEIAKLVGPEVLLIEFKNPIASFLYFVWGNSFNKYINVFHAFP